MSLLNKSREMPNASRAFCQIELYEISKGGEKSYWFRRICRQPLALHPKGKSVVRYNGKLFSLYDAKELHLFCEKWRDEGFLLIFEGLRKFEVSDENRPFIISWESHLGWYN